MYVKRRDKNKVNGKSEGKSDIIISENSENSNINLTEEKGGCISVLSFESHAARYFPLCFHIPKWLLLFSTITS